MSTKESFMASLLATEKLRVEHRVCNTAYFDLNDRIVVLPIFKETMLPEVEDLLIGHEIGHALFTPQDGWHNAVKGKTRGFASFLNIVEDARIERMVKMRYPGMRKQFFLGYSYLLKNEFFGDLKKKKISDFLLIDRINLFFKIGAQVSVEFKNQEEKDFVARVNDCKTWEEVVEIAQDLFAFCKEEKALFNLPDSWSDTDLEEGNDHVPHRALEEGDEKKDEEDEDEDEDERKISRAGGRGTGDARMDDDVESETDDSFSEKIKELYVTDKGIKSTHYVELTTVNPNHYIVPHTTAKNLLEVTTHSDLQEELLKERTTYKKFLEKNSSYINFMAKEFELRKNAQQLAKAKTNKTGVLDNTKLFGYKFNEELFKSTTVVPGGKNHGMIVFLDWSGSMTYHMTAAIEQTLILVAFCRKVNIPFRVYAFVSYLTGLDNTVESRPKRPWADRQRESKSYSPTPNDAMQLIEFFSDKMSFREYTDMVSTLMKQAEIYRPAARPGDVSIRGSSALHLSGTPLNDALYISRYIVDNFKKGYKLDSVNVIVVSDGSSTQMGFIEAGRDVVVIDPVTKNEFRARRNDWGMDRAWRETNMLVGLAKKSTGARYIGFFLANKFSNLGQFYNYSHTKDDVARTKFNSEKYILAPDVTFDSYFLVKGGASLVIGNEELDADIAGATKAVIYNSFKKNRERKILSRGFLTRFIAMIA